MEVRIAVLSDLHAGPAVAGSECRGDLAECLLRRAVNRLRRWLRPDVVLVLGDLVEDATAAGAEQQLRRLAEIIGKLECPVAVLRGNHDPERSVFYRHLPSPGDHLDLKGVRFVFFDDPAEPGYTARRTERDLARMAAAGAGHEGPLVSVQHVPVAPEGVECPYRMNNGAEVIKVMRRCGYALSVAGHYHRGLEAIRRDDSAGGGFLAAPALSRPPFEFLLVELKGREVKCRRQPLAMPTGLHLTDFHVHTPFAYCSEDMDIGRAQALAEDFGLAGLTFTEHASHLCFSREQHKAIVHQQQGQGAARPEHDRFGPWRAALARAGVADRNIGLEVDCDFHGALLLKEGYRESVRFLLGAVHEVGESVRPAPNIHRLTEQFMAGTEKLLRAGVAVLAHPLRLFERKGLPAPPGLYGRVVEKLRANGVAAEVNFHKADPDVEFYETCLRAGVRLTLGSDAHHLSQVGELWPHVELLKRLGAASNLEEVLFDPRGGPRRPVR